MHRAAARILVAVMASLLGLGAVGIRPPAVAAVSPNIVISQVYGGGGNGGTTPAPYQSDFIELYNRGTSTVDVSTWSVQYASATGTSWQKTNLFGSIPAGAHYLVKEANGAGCNGGVEPCGVPLPTPDAVGAIQMSATNGKLALVSNQTAFTTGTSCPRDASVDFVGYGTTANCYEGTGPTAPSLSNTTAAIRAADGATDTDDNVADFAYGAPNPRNNGTPLSLSIDDVSMSEPVGSQLYSFTVSLTAAAPAGGVTFDIATADGTATTADGDYVGASLTGQSIAAGDTSYVFSVVVNGDSAFEPDESFFVNVTNVTGAALGDGQGQGTLVNDDAPPSDPCADPFTPIYQIQGSGPSAATTGDLTTQGVVVGDFEGAAAASGFYIQDPLGDANTATSDGIFVFTGSNASAVSVGDSVRVTGFARERFTQTTINGSDSNTSPVSSILVCSTGNSLPAPTQVLLPVAATSDFEKLEGMYVRFTQSLVIAEYFNYDRFGEIVLAQPLAGETRPFSGTAIDAPGAAANARTAANLLSRITLDDVQSAQNPAVLRHPNGAPFSLTNFFRGGDTVTDAVGVLGFDFSLYRLLPTGPATYAAANPRPTAPADPGGRIRVAAQNALNFFLTLDTTASDTGPGPCGGNANLDCRGADSDQPLEFTRQRDKLLSVLAGLDADVIGLNELENTPGVDPLGDPTKGLVPGLNAIFGAGTYASIDTGVIGTDAIRVGLLYRPGVVTPIGPYRILDSTVDPRFIDTKSRPVLAQTFEENATGERFTVAVNHLKSKGSSCADIGDSDALDGQGNCNATRTLAAQALVDWLATDPTGSNDPDFLIIGDLNSYAREDPITAIKAGPDHIAGTDDDYTNLVDEFLGTYAYSYTFDGQAGYLDHSLSSATLTAQVSGVAEWHINSDEADVFDYDMTFKPATQDALYEPAAYRSSDHDGVIVGLNLVGLPTAVTINAGDHQEVVIGNDFPTQLDLTVLDADGNPVPNATVTFAGPLSGASASIVEAGPYLTDANGNLVVTARANSVVGAYGLVATAGSASVTFHLTNLATVTAQLSDAASCSTFAAGTSPRLSEITYQVKKGNVGSIGGTFSYWVAVTAGAGNNTFTVNQSITTGNFSTLFEVAPGSSVSRSNCSGGVKAAFTQSSTAASAGDVTVSFDAPTAGTYYINLKLSTNSLKGQTAPSPETVQYVFSTTGVAGTTRGLDLTRRAPGQA